MILFSKEPLQVVVSGKASRCSSVLRNENERIGKGGSLPIDVFRIMKTLKIYLDNCTFNRPFDNQSQIKIRLETESKLYIQSGIRERKYSLVWSYMLDYENNDNPYEDKKNAISPWKEIADDYCPSSDDILALGVKIMDYGTRAKDALHIACAVKSGCEYFITTDNRLINKAITNIRIVNPIDFILETEDLP